MKKYLALILLCASCAANDSSDSLAEGGAPVGTGVSQAGAQDFGRFRGIVEAGELPAPNTLDQVGFFNEHKIPLPDPVCGDTVCLHGLMGVQGNMINGNNCTVVLLGFNTPLDPNTFERPPLNLAIAVDTSGSMSGAPIESVRQGLFALADDLDIKDTVSLISYSDDASILIESNAETDPDRALLRGQIADLAATGATNIYDGLRVALEEVDSRRTTSKQNRVILLSDGVATAGITNTDRIVNVGRTFAEDGVGITTIGVGREFDIDLMSRLSETGAGNFYFLEDAGAVEEVFSEEIKTFLVPLAEEIELRFDSDRAYSFRAAYGTRIWEGNSDGATISIPSLFMASRQSTDDIGPGGGRRGGGGMILLELTPTDDMNVIESTPPGSEMGRVTMSYRPPGTTQRVQQSIDVVNQLRPGETPESGEFDDWSVEKAFVTLNIYAGLKMAVERANQGSPGAALNVLEPLSTNIETWLVENPDEDIESDQETMKQLLTIIDNQNPGETGGGVVGRPPDPWPQD